VECDTCKLPYCLVCLASGTKDPCVRCGCRTSKRVEQLVHLRLKSIYKAFKQSGAATLNVKSSMNEGHEKRSGKDGHTISAISAEIISGDISQISKKIGRGTALSIPLPPSIAKYAKSHAKEAEVKHCTINSDKKYIRKDDIGAVLHAAAATAASVAHARSASPDDLLAESMSDYFFLNTAMHPSDSLESSRHRIRPGSKLIPPPHLVSPKVKSKNIDDLENSNSRTLADADAAAAALLAELDEEKMMSEATNQAKKNKKKKKKEKLQAAKDREKPLDDDDKLSDECKADVQNPTDTSVFISQDAIVRVSDELGSANDDGFDEGKKGVEYSEDNPSSQLSSVPRETLDHQTDELETKLAHMIDMNDMSGIETILFQLKGVPGRAALRKNAKKALKRILESLSVPMEPNELWKTEVLEQSPSSVSPPTSMKQATAVKIVPDSLSDSPVYKVPEPLLKVVSQNNRNVAGATSSSFSNRSDCVMHLHPSIVGWVIGRGGQRIRDLMEESGAKLWIDQESMGPKDMRIVYVSGPRKSVDTAVRMVKDLVSKAPLYTPSTAQDIIVEEQEKGQIAYTHSDLRTVSPSDRKGIDQLSFRVSDNDPITHIRNDEKSSSIMLPHEMNDNLKIDQNGCMPIGGVSTKSSGVSFKTSLLLECHENVHVKNGGISQELTCDARFVPLLIGRRGWTIKHIQDTSGARVDIDQTVSPRKIIISGERSQVDQAMQLVRDVLSYPHVQLHTSSENMMLGDEDTVPPMLHPVLGQPRVDKGQGVQSQFLLDPFGNQLSPRFHIDPTQLRSVDHVSHMSFQAMEAMPILSHDPYSQQFQYSSSNTFSNDHQKGVLPPPGIFQHASALPKFHPDLLYPSALGNNTSLSGYTVTNQARENYSQEQLLKMNGPSIQSNPPLALPHNLSRQESTFTMGRDALLRSKFSAESFSENAPNNKLVEPFFSNDFHGSKLDGKPYGISGGIPNANTTQYPLQSRMPNPDDRDIDGMFGPTTFGLNNINNSQGHISPLISEFASAMNFDTSAQGNIHDGWKWNNMTQDSSGPISTLFPSKSKSKRSSSNHSIGLGGVKLDM
jgi:hypothetical protein